MTPTPKTKPVHPMIKHITQAWAITGDVLDAIAAKLMTLTDSGLPALSVTSNPPDQIDVKVVDGIAIIPIAGALAKDHGFTGFWSGVNSGYLGIREQVEKALLMPNVKTILFNVDSPGGTVDGCKECADFLKTASGIKPLYTYVNGQMTSAAYWLGSVGKTIAAPETALIGSIGVRTMHADWSEYDKTMGIKYTHITAGKYKAIPNSDEPLSQEGLDYIQGMMDQTYSIFVNAVASNRNLPPENIANLEAKVLLAGPAVDAGLIDRIETDINTFIDYIKTEEETLMDYAMLKANHPDLFGQVLAEGAAKEKDKTETAVKTALSSAMGLVKEIAGEETGTKIETLLNSGITADQVKIMKTTMAAPAPVQTVTTDNDQQTRRDILDALKTSTAKPTGGGGKMTDADSADFESLVDDHMTKTQCTKGEAMMAMQGKHPEAHKKWVESKQRA